MWILPRRYIGGHHDLSDSTQCTPPSLEKIMPGKVHFFSHYHKLPRSGKKKFYCISFSVLLELVMVCVEGGEESSPRVTVTYLSRYGAWKRWREIESRCGEHQPHWVVRRRNQSKKKKKGCRLWLWPFDILHERDMADLQSVYIVPVEVEHYNWTHGIAELVSSSDVPLCGRLISQILSKR